MIIYIHGFGGSGQGSKAKVFREYFRSIGEDFIAPSLSYVPHLAIETLEELIESYHGEVYLIGSSLGGYYATYLSQMKQVKKVVLLNPAVNPSHTLARAIGNAPNFYDESYYKWEENHLGMLEQYICKNINYDNSFLLMLQKGDELLDYNEAVQKYDGAKQIVEEGGNHSFVGIENQFETIREFFALGDKFKHTCRVKGVGFDNEELANRVGNLYYDDLALFLEAVSHKLHVDAKADEDRGRIKLANSLNDSAKHILQSVKSVSEAWEICKKPTIKWMKENGFNKEIEVL